MNLTRSSVTDNALLHIVNMKALRTLNLEGTKVSDKGLRFLRKIPNLETLELSVHDPGVIISDDSAEALGKITTLRKLSLGGVKITDAGLKHIGALTRLENLALDHTKVTNAGLAHLTQLSHLQHFLCNGLLITDEGAAHLAKIPSLLHLHGSLNLTDQGAILLGKLPKLESLSVNGRKIQITDDCHPGDCPDEIAELAESYRIR